jgi:outer membrane receptor protein involved in Fe transport
VLTGGVTGQDQSQGNPFPQLAIGEYKVITSNYKAQYDQIGSAAIVAVTKSGGNKFEGEVFGRYTDTGMREATVGEDAAGTGKKDTEQKEYGFSLGGPIIQDQLHFFFSYEAKDFVTPSPPVSVPSNWASFESFLPTSVQSQLGPNTKPFNEDLYFAKLTWDIGMEDRLEFSFKRRDEQGRTDVGDRTTASASKINFNTEDRYDLLWTRYGDSFLNEARVTYEDALFNPAPYNIGNQSIYTRGINQNDVLIVSDSTSSLAIQRKGQKGPAFQDDITFNAFQWNGDHVIQAGVKFKSVELTQSENSAINPSFRYSVNDGSLPASPYTPTGTNAIPYQVDFNAPFAGASPIVVTTSKQIGLYIQDDWDVNDQLQLNIGLRWDYEKIPSYVDNVTPPEVVDALLNGHDPSAPAGQTYAQQLALGGIDIHDYISNGSDRSVDKNNFAPRLGFSYDINSDESLVLFGGIGRSYDRNLFDYMGLEQVKSALSSYQIKFVETTGCTPSAGSCVHWDPRYLNGIGELQGLIATNVRNGEIDLLNNDMKTPFSDQISLGLRAKLGEWNTSATIANIHSQDGLVFTLGNRYPNGDFWHAPSWNANDVAQPWEHAPPGFGSLILGNNGIETKTTQLLLSADKPYTEDSGWGVTAAYTYSHARGNRGGDEHYAFDGETIANYPFIDLAAVPEHRFVVTGIYDLPWGLTLSGKATLASPPPLNSIVGWWEYGGSPQPPLIVATDAPGTFGTKQLDLSMFKDFKMTGDFTFQVRADVINVFNNKNISSYSTDWGGNGVYNPETSYVTTGNNVTSYSEPRTIFVSARLRW